MNTALPRAVSDLLVAALPQLASRLEEMRILRSWSSLVGPEVARRTRPGALVGGCLEVVVDNSPWLCELTLRANELGRRVRERFPGVLSLRFVLGALHSLAPEQPAARRAPQPASLSAADVLEVDAAAAAIADAELASTARRVMLKARRWPIGQDGR
jgi:hypothetical protein